MLKHFLDKYYIKTNGYYPFFKYCPKRYWDFYLKKKAYDILGYAYDWHNPKTFNEKVRWLIYNEKPELKTKLTDKILVKQFVASKLGNHHSAQLLGIYNDFDDIDFTLIPGEFALKANSGWKMNIFIKNKNFLVHKKKQQLKKITDSWLKTDYSLFSLEPQYKNIKRRLFIESLRNIDIESLRRDTMVHCFNGEPKFIELGVNIDKQKYHLLFFDTNWNLQNFTYEFDKLINIHPKAPKKLDDILVYAKKLASDFSYVRCDFDFDKEDIHLVEMTFTPYSAMVPFHNKDTDLMLGEMISLKKEAA